MGIFDSLTVTRNIFIGYIHVLLLLLFGAYLNFYPAFHQFTGTFDKLPVDTFDYIIVGAGTAGSILAARLSDQSDANILLLEAGSPLPFLLDIPVLGSLTHNSVYDWQYETVPQENACFALKENRSRWPAGRGVGGTSNMNYMVHTLGHINDYSDWVSTPEHNGHVHWSVDDVQYYYDKSRSAYEIKEAPFHTLLSDTIVSAAQSLGFGNATHLNLNTSNNFARTTVFFKSNNKRWTPLDNLQQAISHNDNLQLQTHANVLRLVIENEKVTGVVVNMKGRNHTLYARKEVILSAGAVGSPWLLMRSGIGPKEVLEPAKVQTVLDLPVGQFLQDHVATGLDLILSSQHLFGLDDLTSPLSAFLYFYHGKGPFLSTLCEAVGVASGRHGSPELEYMVMMAGASSDKGLISKNNLGIKDDAWESYFKPLFDDSVASIMTVLLHPKSIGDIKLDLTNPFLPPIINPNYLSHPDDVETLVDGMEFIVKLVTRKQMRDKGFFINKTPFPGCYDYEFGTRDYWRCYVKQFTLTSYHPAGTCRMGHNSSSSVVDHRLRVHGIRNLRVVDASIMPSLPSANPQATIIMIAEKAADLIMEDISKQHA